MAKLHKAIPTWFASPDLPDVHKQSFSCTKISFSAILNSTLKTTLFAIYSIISTDVMMMMLFSKGDQTKSAILPVAFLDLNNLQSCGQCAKQASKEWYLLKDQK